MVTCENVYWSFLLYITVCKVCVPEPESTFTSFVNIPNDKRTKLEVLENLAPSPLNLILCPLVYTAVGYSPSISIIKEKGEYLTLHVL